MNIGRYIFSQVVDYIPRYQFDKLVAKYHGDWHAKELTCYNQLLHLLFGQLTNCDSLRDICLCLKAHEESLYHLGFRKTVEHTNLSRANEKRDYRIYEELGMYLIGVVRPLYADTNVPGITIDNVLYALDSTTISTSIKLAAWALGKYSKGAVKMHTLLALRGSIPANIHITDGRWHDSNELDLLTPEASAFYMMDRAYVDFDALFRFHLAGAYWVSRPKSNMKYDIIGHRNLTEADKKAEETAKEIDTEASERLSNFSFGECGILPGEEIAFISNPELKATVVDDRRVSYNGETLSLTALAKMLSGKKYSIAGPKFFTYKGEPLNDLRHRLGK